MSKFFNELTNLKTDELTTGACNDRKYYLIGQGRGELSLDECIEDIEDSRDRRSAMMGWQSVQGYPVDVVPVDPKSSLNNYEWN